MSWSDSVKFIYNCNDISKLNMMIELIQLRIDDLPDNEIENPEVTPKKSTIKLKYADPEGGKRVQKATTKYANLDLNA
jgi:hypothetical protein